MTDDRDINALRHYVARLEDDLAKAEVENARLREALEEIANAPVPDTRFNGRGYVPDFDGFKPIARTALAGQEEKGL